MYKKLQYIHFLNQAEISLEQNTIYILSIQIFLIINIRNKNNLGKNSNILAPNSPYIYVGIAIQCIIELNSVLINCFSVTIIYNRYQQTTTLIILKIFMKNE